MDRRFMTPLTTTVQSASWLAMTPVTHQYQNMHAEKFNMSFDDE